VDKNGKWPTIIHNMIIDLAFPNLTANQRSILQKVSAEQDDVFAGGQANAASYMHAMRAPDQTVSEAQSEFQDFVSNEEDQADESGMQDCH
jgi:fructose-specific component phosphotransferase system IIB-like protein